MATWASFVAFVALAVVLPLPVLPLLFPPFFRCWLWLSVLVPSLLPPACVCVKSQSTDLLGLMYFLYFRLLELFTVRDRQDIVTFLKRLMQRHSVEHLMQRW